MPWNPYQYNTFKKERFAPAFDLIAQIDKKPNLKVIDLGCGTGELTAVLAKLLSGSHVTGIDNSKEMLEQCANGAQLKFENKTIEEQLLSDEKWDLIFANASLQWVENHQYLFPKMISKLNPGGQLAIQMPCQRENILNGLLYDLASEDPFSSALNNYNRNSPVLTMDEYAQILFEENSHDINIYQKVYPLIARDHETLYEFISGSATIPYMERLPDILKDKFKSSFMLKIQNTFRKLPAIYAFKRLFITASF